jgi:coenzyme PQQ synthesis protein D (PqqD)
VSERRALPATVRLGESVKLRVGDDRGFLFDQRTGRVYSLNATGAFAARELQTSRDTAGVLEAVVREFEVDAARARHDLVTFVEQLVAEGLAVVGG